MFCICVVLFNTLQCFIKPDSSAEAMKESGFRFSGLKANSRNRKVLVRSFLWGAYSSPDVAFMNPYLKLHILTPTFGLTWLNAQRNSSIATKSVYSAFLFMLTSLFRKINLGYIINLQSVLIGIKYLCMKLRREENLTTHWHKYTGQGRLKSKKPIL